MGTYSAEPIPSEILVNMLKDGWNEMEGKIPKPLVIEINQFNETMVTNLRDQDLVVVAADGGETETLRDAYNYKDVKFDVVLSIYTMNGRQRLYDLKQVIRGIIHTNLTSVSSYHILRYNNFTELVAERYQTWAGMIKVSFESYRVALDTV